MTYIPENPIAIHHSERTFSSRWIELCQEHGIPYRLVDCHSTEIVRQIDGCCGLMWNWLHTDASAAKFARQLTVSLEMAGTPVFPSTRTAWHYDDKLGQKYLFEALRIPHVQTYAFYSEQSALEFTRSHGLPMVFKLTRGAGSMNVRLLKTEMQSSRAIARSFRHGWTDQHRLHSTRERVWRLRRDRSLAAVLGLLKGVVRIFIPHPVHRVPRVEAGYVYLQDFIAGNDSDVRVVVIGNRAYGFRRLIRDGDFRASGSGKTLHGQHQVPLECLKIAFDSVAKMGSQVTAFDFVFFKDQPLVVEVSYAFAATSSGVSESVDCHGFWDEDLNWHNEPVDPERFMLELFLRELQTHAQLQ